MSAPGYEIVPYRPEFAEAVARLHSTLNPLDDPLLSARYLQWKYEENPWLPERLMYVALCDGEPVAMRGAFGSLWEMGPDLQVLPCLADLVVAPEHRDRGLFTQIMRPLTAALIDRGFPYALNLSAAPVTAMAGLAQGFKSIASVDQWGGGGTRSPTSRTRLFQRIDLEDEPGPDAMAALIEEIGGGGPVRHRRDHAFFIWRYRNPLSRYRFLYSRNRFTGRLDGYLVVMDRDDDVVWIMDWEARDTGIAGDLLDAALRVAGPRYLLGWRFGIAESYRQLLVSRGFEQSAQGFGVENMGIRVMAKSLAGARLHYPDSNTPSIFSAGNWDYRLVYADCF